MHFSLFTQKSVEESFSELTTSKKGLTAKEAQLRQKQYGFNEITLGNLNAFEIFLRQVKSPFFYLICGAGIIAFLLGEMIDGLVIASTALVNVGIGFFQEYRAEKTVLLLRKFIAQRVRVLRMVEVTGGSECRQEVIEKKYIVPGDVVLLEAGDIVPADLRVFEMENCLVDESVMTGESVPVSKTLEKIVGGTKEIFKAHNILFAGSSLISGKAKGIVVATAKETAFGEIAGLVLSVQKPSAYEKNIIYFCKLVLRVVLVTILMMFLANIAIKGFSDVPRLVLFSVALVISVLPEALPAVVTFALARGSMNMAKRQVVVRRLSAIEDLGNIEILCTDKTGTITENKLTLEKIVSSDQERCLAYGIMRDDNHGSEETKGLQKVLNPFDVALLARAGQDVPGKQAAWHVVNELPFDSVRMRSSMIIDQGREGRWLVVKGAPEHIVRLSTTFGHGFDKKELAEEISREGISGKRVLAIGCKKFTGETILESDEKGLSFLGYFVFEDPLKSTAKEAITLSRQLGVDIKIITGDSKEVAGYIGAKTGIIKTSGEVITGAELQKMMPDEFDQACMEYFVFARISPETKYNILKSLQKTKEVGFLGEGINDAPALKIANVGIAVPSASDISREVADVVMLEKDLRVIVEGIKEGRIIFANINKYIKCMLASNFGNFYSVAIVSMFINYLPMLPVQILLGNLLSDFPLISVATDTIDIEELKKPKLYQLHNMLPLVIYLSLVSTFFDFIVFMIFKNTTPGNLQTLWFIESILTEIVLIYIIRTRHAFWKTKRPGAGLFWFTVIDAVVIVALPLTWFGQTIFHFEAPALGSLAILFGLVLGYAMVSEGVKLLYFHFWKPPKLFITPALEK